jgi:BirA family biotin operon repressor/biotin-[acetyl-CoA-carboxylase] ligase
MAAPELIRILSDGRLHSGQALAAELGLSRAAVWKQIQRLKADYGLEVQSQPGQGYRLSKALELLDAPSILKAIRPAFQARIQTLEIHDHLESTNAWLLQKLQQDTPSSTAQPLNRVCLAEYQSQGQGRRGRSWQSPFGSNLYCSLLWHSPLPPARLGALSLAIGVAIARHLRSKGCQQIGLKWPNDLMSPQGKVGGILIQLQGEAQGPSDLVIGLGLNLGMPASAAEQIDQPWSDLERLGCRYPRSQLAGELIQAQLEALDSYERHGLAAFSKDWQQLDIWQGREVVIHQGEQRISGRYLGIDSQGLLLLEQAGVQRAFHSGEVSLREG